MLTMVLKIKNIRQKQNNLKNVNKINIQKLIKNANKNMFKIEIKMQ